jgi:hypothetical protein
MRQAISLLILLIFPVFAQEQIFGYNTIDEPLEPGVTSYIGHKLWVYGGLGGVNRLMCQSNVHDDYGRNYVSEPYDSFTIQNIYLVEFYGGGIFDPSKGPAFLITLRFERPLFTNIIGGREYCQDFYVGWFPELSYLQRKLSYESPQDTASRLGWTNEQLGKVFQYDYDGKNLLGMTKEMVLWIYGAPHIPSDIQEAMVTNRWQYFFPITEEIDITFIDNVASSVREQHSP